MSVHRSHSPGGLIAYSFLNYPTAEKCSSVHTGFIPEIGLFLLCSDCSGINSSSGTSAWAAQWLRRKFLSEGLELLTARGSLELASDFISKTCQELSSKLVNEQIKRGNTQTFWCTLDLIWFLPTGTLTAHIGDGGIFFKRGDLFSQASAPETYEELWVQTHQLTRQQAHKREGAKEVCNALGRSSAVNVNLRRPYLENGNRLILASRGLAGTLSSAEISNCLDGSLEQSQAALTRSLSSRAGKAEIGAILIEIEKLQGFSRQGSGMPPIQVQIEALMTLEIFKGLSADEIETLSSIVKPIVFKIDDWIMKQNYEADSFLFILSGSMDIFVDEQYVRTRSERVLIGERAFFTNARRSASVRAKTEIAALRFDRDDFMSLIRQYPSLGSKILLSIVRLLAQK